jgi:hypothetical protein
MRRVRTIAGDTANVLLYRELSRSDDAAEEAFWLLNKNLAEYGPAKAFDEMAEGRGRVRRVYEGLRDSLQLVDPVRFS